MFFLQPTSLDRWSGADVPGIVGILRKGMDGVFEVIDAFDVQSIPTATDLVADVRFGSWYAMAGSLDALRFDAFIMPTSHVEQRWKTLTLVARSCGLMSTTLQKYANVG